MLLTQDQVRAAIAGLQSELKAKKAKSSEADPEIEAKLPAAYNKDEGNKFLAANKNRNTMSLNGGLQYRILKQGNGSRPALTDVVDCHIRSRLRNGMEVEDTYKRQSPMSIQVNTAIKALAEVLPLMSTWSKWELFVPPALAYGEAGAGHIGPNATLIYEVELLAIK